MFKKSLLVASVLGIGGVASGIALADTGMSSTYCKPGFYAGIQAGRGDTFYNQAEVLSEPATYAGFEGHYTVPGSADVDSVGISGRIFGGYQFNPYFALEGGYTQFHKTDFTQTFGGQVSSRYVADRFDGELTEHATDIVAKLTMPFQNGFGAYLKVGAAYIAADRHINLTLIDSGSAIPENTFYTKSYQAVRPTAGVGLDYTIPSTSLDVDISYTEIMGGGGISKTSLAAIGIADKFA
jgi:hypothetical protein